MLALLLTVRPVSPVTSALPAGPAEVGTLCVHPGIPRMRSFYAPAPSLSRRHSALS